MTGACLPVGQAKPAPNHNSFVDGGKASPELTVLVALPASVGFIRDRTHYFRLRTPPWIDTHRPV